MRKSLFFFCLLLLPVSVSAIGVSPPSYLVSWEPGFQANYTHTVINTAGKPMIASVTVKGELAPYITSYDKQVEMQGGSGQFHYSIVMPQEVDLVGYQYAQFYITESDPETGGAGAKTAVVAKLRIEFPYPGIYATYSLSVPSVNEGEDVTGIASLRNLGKETIKDASLTFVFRHHEGAVIATERLDGITFAPGETLELKQRFPTAGVPPGPYSMAGEFQYDKNVFRMANFSIGTHDIDILGHSDSLEKLPISRFTATIKSKWKGTIYNIYGTLTVNGKEHKSPTITLRDFEESTLEFFVTGEDLALAGGNANLKVTFDGKNKEKNLPFTLTDPAPEPEVEAPKEPDRRQLAIPINMTTLLILLVIILVAVNAYILLRKKGNKKK